MSDQDTFVEPKLSPLFTEEQIAARIAELGAQIAADYQRLGWQEAVGSSGSAEEIVDILLESFLVL